jgi:Tfp pilus assembly protein PilV
MKKKENKKNLKKGIVLLEAIIAVSVLGIMFSGVLQLFTRSISTVRIANDTVIASYIAQDAVEFIYAKRRYNKNITFDTAGWVQGIPSTCTINNPCGVETDVLAVASSSLLPCTDAVMNGCLLYRKGDGSYTHEATGNKETPFTRKISVDILEGDATNPLTLSVETVISWVSQGGREENYTMNTILYAK